MNSALQVLAEIAARADRNVGRLYGKGLGVLAEIAARADRNGR